jgi:hypothetical protein
VRLVKRGPAVAVRRLAFLIPAIASSMAALYCGRATADETPIVTDRPSVANSSIVVPQGDLQVENGVQATNVANGAVVDLPESLIRYGVLSHTELRLTVPDYYYSIAGSGASGFGDSAVGLKQQLGPVGGFDVSIIAYTSLPTGATRISGSGYQPGLQLPWSRTLSGSWTIAGQFATYWPTLAGQHNFTGEATVLIERQLSGRAAAFAELASDVPQRGGSRQQLHLGTTYELTPNQQLDFHFAAGLSHAAPRNYIGLGYSFRLQTR